MALTRKQTWPNDLLQFVTDHRQDTFVWGTSDCCLLAADAVLAVTGTDIAVDFRGKYTDQSSAFELIKTLTDGTTVADAAAYCAAKHGLLEWPSWRYAQRGDLVVIQDADQLIAGFVHHDGRLAVSIGEGGLKFLPLAQVTRAWRV